jgi:hypothetical protein
MVILASPAAAAPPGDAIGKTAACIAGLKLEGFSASSTSIRAGQQVTLRWTVDARGCANPGLFTLFLNDASVPTGGSKTVRPSRTISYGLTARGAGIARELGRVRIDVDNTGCRPIELTESIVASMIQNSVRESIDTYNNAPDTEYKVRLRRDPVVEIEPNGVVIRLRMKLKINNLPNPDVDVDAVMGVGVSAENKARVSYRTFTVDVDWPWWVTGISHGTTKIAEEFVDGMVEQKLRDRMRNALRAEINGYIRSSGGVVSFLKTEQDRVVVTICS